MKLTDVSAGFGATTANSKAFREGEAGFASRRALLVAFRGQAPGVL